MTVIMCSLWLKSLFFFFFFASRACVQKNNYHLSDGKMEAKHFHGQSVCKKLVIVREYFS